MEKHWSDKIVNDLVGAFRVFFVSVILIWGAIAVVNALIQDFPIKTNSGWTISIILGILIVFVNFVKNKNKKLAG